MGRWGSGRVPDPFLMPNVVTILWLNDIMTKIEQFWQVLYGEGGV